MTGGVPRYIREFQKRGEIHALIRERVLEPNSFLFRVGRWWDNKGTEIDAVALSPAEDGLVVGECKFWNQPVGLNVLKGLQEKATAIDWNRDTRKIVYVLFSIRGFTPELRKIAKTRQDVLLVE